MKLTALINPTSARSLYFLSIYLMGPAFKKNLAFIRNKLYIFYQIKRMVKMHDLILCCSRTNSSFGFVILC